MARCRINCCSRAPEHSKGTSSIVNASSSSSRHSISARRISRWLTLISVKLVIVALLNDVMTTHGFLVTMTSPTSNDSSSLRLRCAFGTDLGNVSEVTLGKNETESGSWEIVFVYSGDNGTYQFLHKLAGRASAVIGGYHADITIGNATPEDCGLYGCQVTNRFNEVERNFTTIGCAALHTVNSNSTPTPTVPASCSHLPVWATALIVLAGIVVAVLAVAGIIIAAFKITRKLTQVSPDGGRDLSAERNPRLTPAGPVTNGNGAADNKGHSTAKRGVDRKQSLRYSSSQTSKEENDDKNTSKKQKKYKESRENSTESASTKRPHDDENGSKATLKRHKRRESRLKQFDDEEIAEEDGEENTAASQHSDQMSDVERGTRKNQRGNALPPLERKKKKKRKEGEEAMAVMYKDNP